MTKRIFATATVLWAVCNEECLRIYIAIELLNVEVTLFNVYAQKKLVNSNQQSEKVIILKVLNNSLH